MRRPSIEAACALADALRSVSPARLLCVDDLEAEFSAEDMGLLDRFRAADETGRKTILAIAESQARLSLKRRADAPRPAGIHRIIEPTGAVVSEDIPSRTSKIGPPHGPLVSSNCRPV